MFNYFAVVVLFGNKKDVEIYDSFKLAKMHRNLVKETKYGRHIRVDIVPIESDSVNDPRLIEEIHKIEWHYAREIEARKMERTIRAENNERMLANRIVYCGI